MAIKSSSNYFCGKCFYGAILFFHTLWAQHFYYLETTIPVGEYPKALAYNYRDNKVYCANAGSNTVTIINQLTNEIITGLEVGTQPTMLLYNTVSNKIYCANKISSDISVIDGLTDEIINVITVPARPSALLFDSIYNKLYCTNDLSGLLTIIDGVRDEIIGQIQVGACPVSLAYNSINHKIYCANSDDHTVTVIDVLGDSVLATIPVGVFPISLTYNHVNNKIYCASWANGRIHIIDGESDELLDSLIFNNSGCQSLIYLANNNKVAYVNFTGDNIKVIDGYSNLITYSINLEPGARPFFLVSSSNFIYCANLGLDQVLILASNFTTFDSLPVNYPSSILVTTYRPNSLRVYIACLWASSIKVFRYDHPAVKISEFYWVRNKRSHLGSNFFRARSFLLFSLRTNSKIKIFDITGKIVYMPSFTNLYEDLSPISRIDLKSGIYFLYINNEFTEKIAVIK
jgi:YVTN family beta-propeller protein